MILVTCQSHTSGDDRQGNDRQNQKRLDDAHTFDPDGSMQIDLRRENPSFRPNVQHRSLTARKMALYMDKEAWSDGKESLEVVQIPKNSSIENLPSFSK